MAKLNLDKLFKVRAYCSTCGELLMESVEMTRKELLASWDKAVMDAPGIECKKCSHKVPNFNINLKIYNKGSNLEYRPDQILPQVDTKVKNWFDVLAS